MLKKLTEEKLSELLEAGIAEFADHGLNEASISDIAKRAGISVGVVYKYYENKDDFFRACVHHCIQVLDAFLTELGAEEKPPLQYAQDLVCSVQSFTQQHRDYLRLYYEVTRTSNRENAHFLVEEIEGLTSRLYQRIIAGAQEKGIIRRDLEPGMLAFFFDNLLMMMQFSYCCPYYQERFKLYGGENVLDEGDRVTGQLLMFLESAFTAEHRDILRGIGKEEWQ